MPIGFDILRVSIDNSVLYFVHESSISWTTLQQFSILIEF